MKGANTKYPSFPSLDLFTKNLSSLNHPLILTTLYSQSAKLFPSNQGKVTASYPAMVIGLNSYIFSYTPFQYLLV